MDTYPKVRICCTLSTEAERVLHASHKTITGFYYHNNFHVLPYVVPGVSSSVYLPNIDFKSIPDYWSRVRDLIDAVPVEAPEDMRVAIESKLNGVYEEKQTEIEQISKEWEQIETLFWKYLQPFMPEIYRNITEIQVCLTSFGTIASFGRVPFIKPGPLFVYIRKDANISHIGEAILSAILRSDMSRLNLTWEAIESIVDYFILRLADLKIFSNYQPTIASIHKVTENFMEDSIEYMTSLGVRIEKPFRNHNELILFNRKPISSELTSLQAKILTLLLANENQVVSYDSIGDVIWQEVDEYSIWAIHKHMQRLRARLSELGINANILKSVKGRGYSLMN